MEQKKLIRRLAIAIVALSVLLVVLGLLAERIVFVLIGIPTAVLGGAVIVTVDRHWNAIEEFTPTARSIQAIAVFRLGSRLLIFGSLFAYFGELEVLYQLFRDPTTILRTGFIVGLATGIGLGGGTVVLLDRRPDLQKMAASSVGTIARVGAAFVLFLGLVIVAPGVSIIFITGFLLSRLWTIAVYRSE